MVYRVVSILIGLSTKVRDTKLTSENVEPAERGGGANESGVEKLDIAFHSLERVPCRIDRDEDRLDIIGCPYAPYLPHCSRHGCECGRTHVWAKSEAKEEEGPTAC